MDMDIELLLRKWYIPGTRLYTYLVTHSEAVQKKALRVAGSVPHLAPDREFIAEAAMLHDIGIIRVNAPEIDCHGEAPYVCHGILGAEMLRQQGLGRHARVCETHIGVGLSAADIRSQNLPLPERDMLPESIEEKIICYADKFFTKIPGRLEQELAVEDICAGLSKYGADKVAGFQALHALFSAKGERG